MMQFDESWATAPGMGAPQKILVRFETRAVRDEAASAEAGRPIYKEVEYISKMAPGDRTNIVERPVRESDKTEFAAAYRAWKSNPQGEGITGTPLSEWAQLPRTRVEEYRAMGVYTVELLAGMSDSNIQRMGHGALKDRQSARDFLERAKDGAVLVKLRAELDERDNTIATMQEQLRQQAEAIAELRKAHESKPRK